MAAFVESVVSRPSLDVMGVSNDDASAQNCWIEGGLLSYQDYSGLQ